MWIFCGSLANSMLNILVTCLVIFINIKFKIQTGIQIIDKKKVYEIKNLLGLND